jgi:hypothetical protein
MTLASDLHWLISEGYVIEFNDGSLDLPRAKPTVAPAAAPKSVPASEAEVAESTAESPSPDTGEVIPPGEILAPEEERAVAEGDSDVSPVPTAAENSG